MMKQIVFFIFTLIYAVYGWCAEPLTFKGSSAASIGIYISELATGRVVARHNDAKSFVPASVMKCITAASAQTMLDSGSPFTTRVEIRGHVNDGVLDGNLYVVGAGDPTLGSRHFMERDSFTLAVVEWLEELGVDSIAGDIIIDNGGYPAIGVSPYWLLEDTAWEYGAGLYGINYMDNSFSMTLRLGEAGAADEMVEVVNMLKRGQKSDVVAMRGEGSSLLTVSGTLSTSSYTSRYSMPAPEIVLYDDMLQEFRLNGIKVGGEYIDSESGPVRSFGYDSPLRDEILKVMMFKSNNLFAEGMLRAIVKSSDDKTYGNAVAVEKDLWSGKGMDLSTSRWLDGSGLAPVNRISPRVLASILEYMAKSGGSKEYVGLFPRAGREGTVKSLLAKTRLEGTFAMKSGSMNGVLCYAGFKLNAKGVPSHVVVIMVNGASCRSSEIRASIGRYLLSVF